jgi:hypothetical protein
VGNLFTKIKSLIARYMYWIDRLIFELEWTKPYSHERGVYAYPSYQENDAYHYEIIQPKYAIGIAGERIGVGDTVRVGSDGKIYGCGILTAGVDIDGKICWRER